MIKNNNVWKGLIKRLVIRGKADFNFHRYSYWFLLKPVLPVLALLFTLQGCMDERDLSKNVVVAHLSSGPTTLHPTNGRGSIRNYLFQYTQKRLIRPDLRDLKTTPQLVESMPKVSDNGLAYTFTLKQDIQWDDGTPFTVDDVIFTVKVNKCPLTNNTNIRSFYNRIEAIKTYPDSPRKFTLVCNEKYFANKFIFETGLWMMQKNRRDPEDVFGKFSVKDFNDPKFNPNEHPELRAFMKKFNSGKNGRLPERLNGLGPYKVTSWNVGNAVTLKRKEDWWGDSSDFVYNQNHPEKIIFKIIREDFAAGLALKRQSIDVSTYVGVDELIKAQKRDYFKQNYHSDFIKKYGYSYIGLNMRPDADHKPFFVDRKVRRAIAYLVPVNEIKKVISRDKAIRQTSFVSPLKPSYNDTLKPIEKNIDKAKRLLEEAGWKDSDGDNIRDKTINGKKVEFKFQFNYMKRASLQQMALMIKDVMYQAGIVLEPNGMDYSVFYKKAREHDFDAFLGVWSSSFGPVDPAQIWHTKNWANKGLNFVGFGNSTTDSLIELANRTIDLEKRREIMKQLQAIVYREQPYVFLYSPMRKIAIHRRFANAEMYQERPGVILNNLKLKPGFSRISSAPAP